MNGKLCANPDCRQPFEPSGRGSTQKKYCSVQCGKSHRQKLNPEAARERTRRSYAKHRDKRNEEHRKWREEHPEYQKNYYRMYPRKRLINYKNRAKKRGIEWGLTDEQALKLMTSNCYYCGEEGLGIDRVDSSRGYVPGNVVPCCAECNTMKMDTPLDVFLRKIAKIAELWKVKE